MARKMEGGGLIAKVERLKADVAVDNAPSARRPRPAATSRLAQLALRRLLDAPAAVDADDAAVRA